MRLLAIILLGSWLSACAQEAHEAPDWRSEAEAMVDQQIASRGVRDPEVLSILKGTPRHRFVPRIWRALAYQDQPLPIGEGQTISQPYIVGLMTELLELTGTEKVLEIGTGSGYQAAILARLAAEVFSIEIVRSLADSSAARLQAMGYGNITVRCGDGYQGWPEHAPFDRIIVTAAPPEIPEALVQQLKPGGIMVLPVGDHYQELVRIHKQQNGLLDYESVIPVRFVPMVKGKSDN